MATHLVIFLKDGHIQFVLSDFRNDSRCLIISACDTATPDVMGEPWVQRMEFLEEDNQLAVLEPIAVEFDPERVRKIISMKNSSKRELLELLGRMDS